MKGWEILNFSVGSIFTVRGNTYGSQVTWLPNCKVFKVAF